MQKVYLKNGNHLFLDWNFELVNDSVTQIMVNTLDDENSFQNRLEVLNLFVRSENIAIFKSNFTALNTKIDAHQNYYRIALEDTTSNPASNCTCITSSSNLEKKSNGNDGDQR